MIFQIQNNVEKKLENEFQKSINFFVQNKKFGWDSFTCKNIQKFQFF